MWYIYNLKIKKKQMFVIIILKKNFLNFTCETFNPLPWFISKVTVVVTVKLLWFWLMPGLAHLGGGGGGVFIFCAVLSLSVIIFLISDNSGDVAHDALFWWKLEVEINFSEFLVKLIVVDFGVSRPFLRVSKLLTSCAGLKTLFSTLWTTGDGHRILCTRFGDINLWESLSLGDKIRSFLLSLKGSLKVVRLRVFGGVGRGWRGNDEANVDVFALTVFVGEGVSAHKSNFR